MLRILALIWLFVLGGAIPAHAHAHGEHRHVASSALSQPRPEARLPQVQIVRAESGRQLSGTCLRLAPCLQGEAGCDCTSACHALSLPPDFDLPAPARPTMGPAIEPGWRSSGRLPPVPPPRA